MKTKKAFTLIELLIVVAIIAILAAIAIPNFLEAQTRSKVARCQADMRTAGMALEAYRIDCNAYPMANSLWSNLTVDDYPWMQCSYLMAVDETNTWPDGSYRTYSVRELTTPIAYMTGFPWDPFTDAKRMPGNYARFSYGYVNFAGLSKHSLWPVNYGMAPEIHLVPGSKTIKRTSWLLVGNGPDATSGFGNLGVVPDGIQAIVEGGGADWLETYDPSNGTISSGDIFRCQ